MCVCVVSIDALAFPAQIDLGMNEQFEISPIDDTLMLILCQM